MNEISKKFCDFAVMHNLQITKLTCSNTTGTINFKMLGQKPLRNKEGSICGSERSFHGGGNSRSRRRARRQSKQAAATDSSSGYESGQTEQLPIEGSTEKEQEKGELPAKPVVVLTESKAKTDEKQELEKVREIISQYIDFMMVKANSNDKSKFKHLLDNEKIINAATVVVTKALRSTKYTNVAVTSRRHKNSSAAKVRPES